MATWTDQPLGNTGNLDRVDLDWGIDEMVEPYGLEERRYWKSSTLTISTEQQICAIGLAQNAGGLGGSGDISEVSYAITEQGTDPNMFARFPGTDVETGVRLMYVGTDCFIFTATELKYSISGQGVPPIPQTAQNDFLSTYVTTPFLPAHGVGFEIAVDSAAQIGSWKQSQPKDAFWTWSVDATAVIANPSPSSSNLLTPDSEVTDLIPSSMIGFYSNTQRMSKGKNNRATSSWQLTLYPTS